jgi:hypothetical protein
VDERKSCTIAIALRTLRNYEAQPRLVPRGARAWQTFYTRSGLSDTWVTECHMLARAVTDHSKQKQYEYLSAHYSYLAASFREALAMYSAALAKLTLH